MYLRYKSILGRYTMSDKKPLIDKDLLKGLNEFLDTHYEFRSNSKYKGFFGRIRASADRAEYEQRDHYSARSFDIFLPSSEERIIYYSDPISEEQQKTDKKKREEQRLQDIAKALEESFSSTLMKLIESKNKDAVDIYKQANIDRKLFSKIRSDKRYMPSKRTALAFAIALELSLDETNDLLKRAGFTLSRSLLFDVIIEYFITRQNYDIYEINDVLFSYKQPILGE